MADVLVVGCGYTGLRLARRLLAEGHRVVGTTRREERAEELAEAGVEPRLADVSAPETLRLLADPAPDACFYFVPPLSPEGDPPTEPGVAAALEALARAPLVCFVYASSTSVYGDRAGAWVDETTLPAPDSPAGRGRLAAERTVLRMGWTRDARPRVARIAGIYGPGRTLRRRLEEGRHHVVEGVEAWSNRIHVDDLVTGLRAAWAAGTDGRVYDMSDGSPHRSAEYARYTAELLGLDVPTLTLEEARARYGEDRLARKLGSKRVSNRRLREELGVELRYPDFRAGVRASLEEEGALSPAG